MASFYTLVNCSPGRKRTSGYRMSIRNGTEIQNVWKIKGGHILEIRVDFYEIYFLILELACIVLTKTIK